jgi:hypothetical protein
MYQSIPDNSLCTVSQSDIVSWLKPAVDRDKKQDKCLVPDPQPDSECAPVQQCTNIKNSIGPCSQYKA